MDVVTLGAALSIMKKMPDTAASSAAAAEDAADRAEAAAEQAEGAIEVDDTLSVEGRAADAKVTGDKVNDLGKYIQYTNNTAVIDLTETATASSYYINSLGVLNNSAKWASYFHVISHDEYEYVYEGFTSNVAYFNIGFYSGETPTNRTWIDGLHLPTANAKNKIILRKSDIPEGTKGILFCSFVDGDADISLACYVSGVLSQLNANSADIAKVVKKVIYVEDLIPYAFDKTSNYIQASGVLSQSAKWTAYWFKAEDIYSVDAVKTFSNTLVYYQIGFYNSETVDNTTFISGYKFQSTTGETETTNVIIPDNTVVIVITNRDESGTDIGIDGVNSLPIQNLAKTDPWEKYDKKFNLIAYSAVNNPHNYMINTLENYEYAGKVGYDGIKGDVRITSDDELVMCHDVGITLDENNEIISFNANDYESIRNLTFSQVKNLVFAQRTDENLDMHVPSFEEYVFTCKKYGSFCYPTLRNEYIDTILPLMFSILDKYDMRTHTIVNSMTYSTLTALREIDKEIPVTFTKDIRSGSLSESDIKNTIRLGNSGLGFYAANGVATTAEQIESKIADNMRFINMAKESGVRIYGAIASSNVFKPMLINGFSGTHAVNLW